MKLSMYVLVLPVLILAVAGCAENQTRIGEGTAIGGLLGAAAGGIIGHQSGDGTSGALIGGAIGAAGGAAVGAQIPKERAVNSNQGSPVSSISRVTMQQVVDWTKQGLPSDEIISRISSTHTTYSLTAEDINYLSQQGVSQRVIDAMQAAR